MKKVDYRSANFKFDMDHHHGIMRIPDPDSVSNTGYRYYPQYVLNGDWHNYDGDLWFPSEISAHMHIYRDLNKEREAVHATK